MISGLEPKQKVSSERNPTLSAQQGEPEFLLPESVQWERKMAPPLLPNAPKSNLLAPCQMVELNTLTTAPPTSCSRLKSSHLVALMLGKTMWQLLKILNGEFLYDTVDPFLGIYTCKSEKHVCIQLTHKFHSRINPNSQKL